MQNEIEIRKSELGNIGAMLNPCNVYRDYSFVIRNS